MRLRLARVVVTWTFECSDGHVNLKGSKCARNLLAPDIGAKMRGASIVAKGGKSALPRLNNTRATSRPNPGKVPVRSLTILSRTSAVSIPGEGETHVRRNRRTIRLSPGGILPESTPLRTDVASTGREDVGGWKTCAVVKRKLRPVEEAGRRM